MRDKSESANGESAASKSVASRLIEEILELNPSADAGFLGAFPAAELELYRRRLQLVTEAPKSLPWVRRNDVWPVAMRESA